MQRLSGKKRIAADALLNGAPATAAATEAGVSRVTLWKWTKEDPAFVEALRTGTDAALASATRRLKANADNAVSTLLDVMNTGGGHRGAVRLRAAEAVLSHGARLAELVELVERVDALEARQ